MDIKKRINESQKQVATQDKTNFGQLITKGGVGLKNLMSGEGQSKIEALSESMYQIVELPSRGWSYPQGSVLSSGKVKLKYPTGADEALLSSQNLTRKGIAVDQFLKALILDNFKLQDLLSGDKLYLIFAARRLTYGNDYKVEVECNKCNKSNTLEINLAEVGSVRNQELFEFPKQQMEYQFVMPSTSQLVKFRLQNGHISDIIEKRTTNSKTKNAQTLISLSCMLTEFDDATQYVDILKKLMVSRPMDLTALRIYISKLSPEIDIKHSFECQHCYKQQEVNIPIGVSFFWPAYA